MNWGYPNFRKPSYRYIDIHVNLGCLKPVFLMASSFLSKYKVIFRSAMVIVAIGASDKVGRNGVIVPWNDHKWSWGLCYYYGVYYEYDGGHVFLIFTRNKIPLGYHPIFVWSDWLGINGHLRLYCVAPLKLGPLPLVTYDFWLIGKDCCQAWQSAELRPEFRSCWGQVTFLKRFSQFSMVSSPVLLVFHKVLTDTLETDPPQIMRNSAVMTWGRPWKMLHGFWTRNGWKGGIISSPILEIPSRNI